MKKLVLLTTLFFCITIITAQSKPKIKGDKIVTIEERELTSFTALELNDKVEVVLKQGGENKLIVEADSNLHDVIDADVKGNKLVISLNKRVTRSKRFNLTLYVEDLDQIVLNQSSEIVAEEKLEFFNLDVVMNDKSDIELKNLHVQLFQLEGNGRSKGEFIVKTDSLSINSKKSSKVKIDVVSQNGAEINYAEGSVIEITGKASTLLLKGVDNGTFKGAHFNVDMIYLTALDRTDTYVSAKERLEIEAKNKAEVYIFGKQEIILNAFEDDATLFKRESMTILENL